MDGSVGIGRLPNELLYSVFGHLETPGQPAACLQSIPADIVSNHSHQALKATSLVCKRWRHVSKEHLFRHLVWRIDRHSLQRLEGDPDRSAAIPPLRFIHDNNLACHVDSFTLIISNPPQNRPPISDIILSDFAPEKHLAFNVEMNWLWATILEEVDPLRLTIVASPKTLAWLFSRMVFLGDDLYFYAPHHIVSVARESRERLEPVPTSSQDLSDSGSVSDTTTSHSTRASNSTISSFQSRCIMGRTPCNLFTAKEWTSILINEGCHMNVYRLYEYTLKRPPSILGALLGCEEYPNNSPLIPHSVRSLSYICTAPVSGHWNQIIRFLPRLDKFFFRVWNPNPANYHHFGSTVESMHVMLRRNDLYLSLMRAVFGRRRSTRNSSINWRYLKEIESGDQENDACMYLMSNTMVTRRAKRGWCLEKPGLLVRDDSVPVPPPGQEDDDDDDWSGSD